MRAMGFRVSMWRGTENESGSCTNPMNSTLGACQSGGVRERQKDDSHISVSVLFFVLFILIFMSQQPPGAHPTAPRVLRS